MANLYWIDEDGVKHPLPARGAVSSVNGKTGVVVLGPNDIGAQSKITANGILKGDGEGGVTEATADTDYVTPTKLSQDLSGKVDINQGAASAGKWLGTDANGDVEAKDLPIATDNVFGVVKSGTSSGVGVTSAGMLYISGASQANIDSRNTTKPIIPTQLDYAIRAGLLSNSQITNADKPTICNTIGAQPRYTTQTVTIAAASWSGGSVTVSVAGVKSDSLVQLTCLTKSDLDAYANAGVFCSAQGTGTLTFTCEATPTATITLGAVIW